MPVILVDNNVVVGFDRGHLEQLLARTGTVGPSGRPALGLSVADAGRMVSKAPWLAGREGAYVGGAKPGSPGARAGIGAGDLIVAVDGHAISRAADLERELASGRRRFVFTVANPNGTRQAVVEL
ncbi:MAG: PDZ domain-containing protein [Chloroflexota bacterium]